MAWYWWVLIGIGCVAVMVVKIKVLGKIMNSRKNSTAEDEE